MLAIRRTRDAISTRCQISTSCTLFSWFFLLLMIIIANLKVKTVRTRSWTSIAQGSWIIKASFTSWTNKHILTFSTAMGTFALIIWVWICFALPIVKIKVITFFACQAMILVADITIRVTGQALVVQLIEMLVAFHLILILFILCDIITFIIRSS